MPLLSNELLIRHSANPLIRPHDARPSRPDFEVIGTFNAGAARFGDETILLVRVAERPIAHDPQRIYYPHLSNDNVLTVRSFARNDPRFDAADARLIHDKQTGEVILTSLSHLRLARSADGVQFRLDEKPWLSAAPPYENFGVEDARISPIEGLYYINYSAVSRYGIATGLVSTADFMQFTRCGLILPPANRDVVIFPERINGQYVCYHRPMPGLLGGLNMWQATSPDLVHWGDHRLVLEAISDGWEAGRVGGGAPPIRTDQGWLSIYNAADRHDRYCLGAFLTALADPGRVLARSRQPILWPQAEYETRGFFPGVVFSCGAVLTDGVVRVYYGAADESIALAEVPLADVLAALRLGNS